ncbi:MAG: glycosyltransferase family 9 protein [bacterium]|nr:glycosyltransferase family 9 protein [bacterium]
MSDTGSILVIRLSSLGDVLLCAPAMRALRTRFPEAKIDFLVASEFAEAAQLLPGIDSIITLNKNEGWRGLFRLRRLLSRRYEMIFDLQNSLRSSFLRMFCFPLIWAKASRYRFRRWLLIRFKKDLYGNTKPVPLRYIEAMEAIGVVDDGLGLQLSVPTNDIHSVKSIKRAVLCPGAKHNTKRWPIENWEALARDLRQQGFELTVCGSKSEADDCRRVGGNQSEVLIDSPLKDLGQRMMQADVVVCHDSGLMHLASGVNAPLVAIFGPTVEQFGFFPFRANSIVVQQDLTCRPCTAFGGATCPLGHHDCMKKTTPEQVEQSIETLIESRGERG